MEERCSEAKANCDIACYSQDGLGHAMYGSAAASVHGFGALSYTSQRFSSHDGLLSTPMRLDDGAPVPRRSGLISRLGAWVSRWRHDTQRLAGETSDMSTPATPA